MKEKTVYIVHWLWYDGEYGQMATEECVFENYSDTEEYIVELDKLKKAMQALADVQQEIEKTDTELDAAETSEEKYDLLG